MVHPFRHAIDISMLLDQTTTLTDTLYPLLRDRALALPILASLQYLRPVVLGICPIGAGLGVGRDRLELGSKEIVVITPHAVV